jgi:hypothetical protein
MVTAAQVRQRLQDKLFSQYGKTATLRTRGTPTYNERGDITTDSISTSSITVVPYDVTSRKEYERFSEFRPGEVAMAVPYTVSLTPGDEIVLESVTYDIKEVIPNYLVDNVVSIIRCAKIVA